MARSSFSHIGNEGQNKMARWIFCKNMEFPLKICLRHQDEQQGSNVTRLRWRRQQDGPASCTDCLTVSWREWRKSLSWPAGYEMHYGRKCWMWLKRSNAHSCQQGATCILSFSQFSVTLFQLWYSVCNYCVVFSCPGVCLTAFCMFLLDRLSQERIRIPSLCFRPHLNR